MINKFALATTITAFSLAIAPAQADWTIGGQFSYIENGAVDIDITALMVSAGYQFDIGEHFFINPEIRKLLTSGDSEITVANTAVDIELEDFKGIAIRGGYQHESGFYVVVAPSYANLEYDVSVDVNQFGLNSALGNGGDEDEFSLGYGLGFHNENLGFELLLEKYDETEILSWTAKFLL